MARRHWLLTVPLVLLLGIAGRTFVVPELTRGAERRIEDPQLAVIAAELGHHLYAPTWLPHEGRVGSLGVRRGNFRILQDFTDNQDRSLCILAQERRSAQRDGYHETLFAAKPDATAMVGDARGYFVTGTNGERRLFWNEPETALILSSAVLTDEELLRIAEKIR
jgi:hypothetical protein